MRYTRTILLIMLAAALSACGSDGDNVVLAEFRDHKITKGELEEYYAKLSPDDLPKTPGVEGYKEFLETMINKDVLAYKADELGYDKDPTVVESMEAFMKIGLQAGFLKLRVGDKVVATEDDIRFHYDNFRTTLSVKQILVDTPEVADEVYDMLGNGADFESVCKQYSRGPDAQEGGKVLTLAYGSYGPNMQRALFTLPIGHVSKPIETPYGFFIIKVLKRDTSRRPPLDEVRERLEQEVLVLNEMILTNEMSDGVRERAGVTWYYDNFQTVFDAFPADRPLSSPPQRGDEIYPLLFFDEGDYDQPLLSYNDKVVTVRDLSDYYDRASFFGRPRREFRFGGIKSFLTQRLMNDLVQDEMERSGVRNEPEMQRAIRAKREQLMIGRLFEDMVNSQTVVTERAIRNYYNDNQEAFRMPERRAFGVILTGDIDTAKKAYAEIQGGAKFRTVTLAYTIDPSAAANRGQTELLSKGENPELDVVGFSMADIGDVSEPFETSRGWIILRLVEVADEQIMAMEQAHGSVQRVLKTLKNEERLDELLKQWREEYQIIIHEDNLKKINVEPVDPDGRQTT